MLHRNIGRFIMGFVFLCFATNLQASEVRSLSGKLNFGIVPQQSPIKLLRAWKPLLDYLSLQTGLQFEFKTAPDIPTFETRLAAGEYDFAYMNPYHFTVFNDGPGYLALEKAKDKRIRGVLVVPINSPIKNISELNGKTLAFPAPAAFAATLLIQGQLKQQDINFQSTFVNSHDSVYRVVAKNIYTAGGGGG